MVQNIESDLPDKGLRTAPPQWREATQAIQAAQTVLVVTHVLPDGDAIGSLMGLVNALRTMHGTSGDFKVDCAVDGGVPDSLMFLPGAETVQAQLESGSWDVMVSLDASDEERSGQVGIYGRANSRTVINLDHHATNTIFGDIFLVDPQAVSATEIVFRWLQTMGYELTKDVATALLTGLVTDTVGFRTSNVTANTLAIAQTFMQAGASLTEVTQRALDIRPFDIVRLWGEALRSVKLDQSGIITTAITRANFQSAGVASDVDTGLSSFLIRVEEANISAVFQEGENGEVTLSFRSKPGFDVAEVAFGLGGGGHRQASGATIPGPLEEAQARVMALLHEAVAKGKLVIA